MSRVTEVSGAPCTCSHASFCNDWLMVLVMLSCSHVISAKDKQATFICQEKRVGVWILPFLMAGINDKGRPKPTKSGAAPTAARDPSSSGAAIAATDEAAADVAGGAAPAGADPTVPGWDGKPETVLAGSSVDAADGQVAEGLGPSLALLWAL